MPEDNNNKLLNVVIYSKDRAMQLEALLESLNHFLFNNVNDRNVTVIYKASTEDFQKGYERLLVDNDQNSLGYRMVPENDFRIDTMAAIDPEYKYTMFLVDDIMFYRAWSLEDKPFQLMDQFPDGIMAVSLRLGSNTSYCYPLNRQQAIPKFHKECAWRWVEADGDFGYPMSLDGNVFHTKKILEILNRIQSSKFTHPNTLEGALNDFAQMRKHAGTIPQIMVCYPASSRLINNPCNRVQNVVQNKTESSYDPKSLNDMYLSGRKINEHEMTSLLRDKHEVNAAHYPMELVINE